MDFESRTLVDKDAAFSKWRPYRDNPVFAKLLEPIFLGTSPGMVVSIEHESGTSIQFRRVE